MFYGALNKSDYDNDYDYVFTCHVSHFPLRSARAHVLTPSLYIRNGLTDRAQICCVVESLFVTRFSHVMGHISHCGLHVRTCTPHIYISGTAWPIALKFVVYL